MASETNSQSKEILQLGFNNDYSLITCGTESGFNIFNVNPLTEQISVDLKGGIRINEVLLRSNMIAVTGGSVNPAFPTNKTMLWDDDQKRFIGELTFRSQVRGVKISKAFIVIILEYKIYIYILNDLKIYDSIETIQNTKGLCDFRFDEEKNILACPGMQVGSIRIEYYYPNNKDLNKAELIDAHEGPIACLVLSQNGKLLATASDKGTLIRVYNTQTRKQLNEFRRGLDPAEIYHMAFNKDENDPKKDPEMLVALSSKGTVHVFMLNEPYHSLIPPVVKEYLPKYFNSTWSTKQYRFTQNETNSKTIVGFIDRKTVIVATITGNVYKINFDPDDKYSSTCTLQSVVNFNDKKSII